MMNEGKNVEVTQEFVEVSIYLMEMVIDRFGDCEEGEAGYDEVVMARKALDDLKQ